MYLDAVVRKALTAAADGEYTRDEAVAVARDAFDAAMGFKDVELTEEARNFIYRLLESGVDLILENTGASAKALSLSRLPVD